MPDLIIKVEGTIDPGKIKENVSSLEKTAKMAYDKQGISAEQYKRISDLINDMKGLADKSTITSKELTAFNGAFKQVESTLQKATDKIIQFTEEAKKLSDALEEQKTLREKAKTGRSDAREAQETAINKYRDILKNNNVKVGNTPTTNLETLIKHAVEKEPGKWSLPKNYPVRDEKTGALVDNATRMRVVGEINKQITAYKKSEQEIDYFSKALEIATAQVAQLEEALDKKTKEDFLAGKSQNPEYVDLLQKSTEGTQSTIDDLYNQKDVTRREMAISKADINYQEVDQNAKKATQGLGKGVIKQISLYAIALRYAGRAMSEFRRTVVDLDKSLTEQAMVTGKTRKEVYGLLKGYQDLAIQTGSTTKEVSATVTEFIRQGKSTQEAMTLAEAAISAAKVAAINTSDSINYLTTALNGFGLSASQAMEVSDKFAAVSANAATSYEEIAIALSKVASQANLAGMSIDYTTALLAKGLETTREAPETIGTALKTVIARMREITDYGETLEDGVDLNNVESQLAYVGIALRTTGGELRTTEAVLDDLGKKWDTLNSNQQAAIAKALAGTRQQSRLIAMMSDYERVVELQEISARSAGATMAQMGTYTEGLEAALNRLATSWEKIISTVVNSDFIIDLVNFVTNALDNINNLLSALTQWQGTWVAVGYVIIAILSSQLSKRIKQAEVQRLQLKYSIQRQKQELTANKLAAEQYVLLKKNTIEETKKLAKQNAELIIELKKKKLAGEMVDAELLAAEQQQAQYENEINTYAMSEQIVNSYDSQMKSLTQQETLVGRIKTGFSGLLTPVFTFVALSKSLYAIGRGILGVQKKQTAEEKKQTAVKRENAAYDIAGNAAQTPYVGWIIAGTILAAMIGLTIAGIAALGTKSQSEDEKATQRMNELSNSIHTLTKRSEAIQTAVNKVEDLDNKLIKSKQDAEELADTLAQVGDKLSSEKADNLDKSLNESEKDFYEKLTDSEKIEYLKKYQKLLTTQLEKERSELASVLRSSGIRGNDAENRRLMARSLAKTAGYTVLDTYYSNLTATETSSRRTIMEKIVENIQDDNMLLSLANNTEKMKRLLDDISNIKLQDGSVASDILQDDNSSLKERVEAFRLLKDQLISNSVAYQGIVNAYKEFNVFASWDNDLLELIDTIHIANDEINDLYTSYDTVIKTLREKEKQLGLDLGLSDTFQEIISGEEYQKALIEKFLPRFAETNMNAAEAMRSAFGELLSTLDSDEYEYVYNAILNQVAKAVQVGIQNIGQNVDKLKNSVSSIYTTVEKWNEMTNTEQSQFLSENAELFAGSDGAKLQQAFILKDYQAIQKALSENGTLRKNIEKEIKELNAELNIELAKLGDERNQATIDFLRERIRQLSDEGFFSVDLETLVEQENKRIEAYKELLQKEEDTLKKSLEDRKAAYEKYFDAINQAAEDEEYEEKADLFISNLTKLSGSTNAEALAKTEELQNSLAELEKERLQTLRERAQEAVIQSIDDTITSIDKHFEELIATNREILNMLNGTSGNELVASLLSTESFAGKTANEAQLYLNEIQSTFGSQVSNIDWNNMKVTNTGGNLTLNIGDKVIQLTGQEAQGRNIYDAILAALVQNGISA